MQESRIIVAFDFDDITQAKELLQQLQPELCKIKIGKTMFTRFGPDWVKKVIDAGFDVFLDLKFHDIPNTVAHACKAAADLGIWMLNVHALGGLEMLKAAKAGVSEAKLQPKLIAVTLLTSLEAKDCKAVGLPQDLYVEVERLAFLTQQAGLDGIVCSPQETRLLRAKLGPQFLLVTPGIRLTDNHKDDQRRIMTPERAIAQGADYLVMGRPITNALEPAAVLNAIHKSLQNI